MVHHEAGRLHEGVADGWPRELEAGLLQGPRYRLRLRRSGRTGAVNQGSPARPAAQPWAKGPLAVHKIEVGTRVVDGGMYFGAVAHNPRIVHEFRNPSLVVTGHPDRIKAVERLQEGRPLVKDHAPGEARLERIQDELAEEGHIVMHRHAPLLVVVRPQAGAGIRPRATQDAVRTDRYQFLHAVAPRLPTPVTMTTPPSVNATPAKVVGVGDSENSTAPSTTANTTSSMAIRLTTVALVSLRAAL